MGQAQVQSRADARIAEIELGAVGAAAKARAEIEAERKVAVHDLLEDNAFAPIGHDGGPYRLEMTVSGPRIALTISELGGAWSRDVEIPVSALRAVMRDYFMICESYFDAMRDRPHQIEAIDMARRAIHNEGAELLTEKLEANVEVDQNTARRLFTLLCVMKLNA